MRLPGQHERALYAGILAAVPNRADADEIAQETKLRLWEQFDQFEPGTQFGAWARMGSQNSAGKSTGQI